MRRHLLRGFVSKELADRLDLDSLQTMPTEFVDARLGQQRSDMVWRVNFREGGGELYVVVLTEFQATVDQDMPLRMVHGAARKLLEEKRLPGGKLPPVLPVVVYSGERRWSVPREMKEMVGPVDEELQPFQLQQRYFLLDLRGRRGCDAGQRAVRAGAGRARPVGGSAACAVGVAGGDRPGGEASRSGCGVGASGGGGQVTGETLKKLKSFEETGELGGSLLAKRQAVDESRAEGRELGLTEGRELGLSEGRELGLTEGKEQGLEPQRAILLRQAARKFGADTATRLEALLADDPDRLAVLGDHVIDSDDGEELLSRATTAAGLH